jgi:hypothetical protein
MAGQIPRPYVSTVPDKPDPITETVDFVNMGIGARKSGMPKGGMNNVRSIEHVGGSAGKK